jgi:hypothetical protein
VLLLADIPDETDRQPTSLTLRNGAVAAIGAESVGEAELEESRRRSATWRRSVGTGSKDLKSRDDFECVTRCCYSCSFRIEFMKAATKLVALSAAPTPGAIADSSCYRASPKNRGSSIQNRRVSLYDELFRTDWREISGPSLGCGLH